MRLLRKILLICTVFILGGWLLAAGAGAHSIYIFAFSENSQICTSSYFGGKAKVRGGNVSMKAASGQVMATAQTDDQGRVCFDRPELNQDLIFTVEASGGHRAEFKLPASASYEGEGAASSDVAHSSADPDIASVASEGAALVACTGALTNDDLQKALAPIMLKLAEMESAQSSRVELKDIVGGLGWLIGLAGAALWAGNRRKTRPRAEEKA